MLSTGDHAPDLSWTAADGAEASLSKAGPAHTVLFFFPRAFSPGCTRETRQFHDRAGAFEALGAQVVGVSRDPAATLEAFSQSLCLSFPLVNDQSGKICQAYGVLWPLLGVPRRVTFIIAPGQRIAHVLRHEIHIAQHVDGALRYLDTAR